MHHIPAWEERLAEQDLGKDAANGPDVNGRRVLCKEGPTELWSPVPSMTSIRLPTAFFHSQHFAIQSPPKKTGAYPASASTAGTDIEINKQIYRAGSSPSCGDIVCPEDGGGHVVEGWARQAKVTDLELAVSVCQDVFGLQIPMEHLGCMSPQGPSRQSWSLYLPGSLHWWTA